MLKGLKHKPNHIWTPQMERVKNPMLPKGVEHQDKLDVILHLTK